MIRLYFSPAFTHFVACCGVYAPCPPLTASPLATSKSSIVPVPGQLTPTTVPLPTTSPSARAGVNNSASNRNPEKREALFWVIFVLLGFGSKEDAQSVRRSSHHGGDLLESCIGNPRHDCSGSRLTRPLQNGDRRRSPLSRRTKTMKHLSRILFLVGLTASLLLSAGVANAADPTAIKVALKADSGNLLARCHGCVPNGAYPDNAAVH